MKEQLPILACLALALCATAAAVHAGKPKTGELRICRTPSIVETADGKPVDVPAGKYTGERRSFIVAAPAVHLGSGKRACVTTTAVVEKDDGRPIDAGETLLPQWALPGFTPTVKAAGSFK